MDSLPFRTLYQARGLRFGLVGLSGVLVNNLVLWALARGLGMPTLAASLVATELAILSNFLLNDRWTFRSGGNRHSFGQRLLRYHGVAAGGAAISIGALALLTAFTPLPLLAANMLAIAAALSWNYTVNSRLTWGGAAPATLPRDVGAWLAALAVAAAAAWVVAAQPGAWAGLAALLLGAALLSGPGVRRAQARTTVLAAAAGVATLNYMAWRAGVISWEAWWVGLPLYAAELFGAAHSLGLLYTAWPRPADAPAAGEDPTRRPIFILIPTVDEGPAVLEPTIRGALAAREAFLAAHPHGRVEVVVCNDGLAAGKGRWREAEEVAARLGVRCVTRATPGGAKAGNLEHARTLVGATGEALLVIFDADQVAEPEFLLATVPLLADPRVGWVQSGQFYRNLENPVARWANDQQALFYHILCPGKSAQNAAFICGTNVVLRAAALDEIGGLPQDSVTEDFAASIELHPRWRSVFVPGVLATGLGPMDLGSYFKQQGRWATGSLGVLRSHWRQIFVPGGRGLSLAQRIQYGLAATHYLSGLRDLVYILAPLLFLLGGVAAIRGATLEDFVWHFLPYWLLSQVAFWHLAWGRSSMRGVLIGFASFPVLIASLATVLAGRRTGFATTAKRRAEEGPWARLWPHALALATCAAGLGAVLWSGLSGAALVSAAWVLYSAVMLAAVLWLGWLDARADRGVARRRFALRLPPRPMAAAAALVALCLALPLALAGPGAAARAAPFQLEGAAGAPLLGLSLPEARLGRADELEGALGRELGLIRRTQVISDRFDRGWADGLAATGRRPWVTLLFGVPGEPALESSLPAVANGVHDADLRRWARAMRDYGRPVYLTVLPHVDRNWAVSSGVANGGIPQDTPRAWRHVRELLRDEGADNVALVWAPADPARDQEFAPPPELVDAVLLSLISYPDAEWADPSRAVAAVQARYPATPLLLEVSAEGPEERKAAWLRSVGRAAAESAGLHALLYHEGAPDPDAAPSAHAAWSMTSSPDALQAMRESADAAIQTPIGASR